MGAVMRPFFDNPKDVKPDVKALALLLRRSGGPLPRSFLARAAFGQRAVRRAGQNKNDCRP